MSSYVLAFRSPEDRVVDADEEAAWGQWFQQIGASVVDFGHRVGRVRTLGPGTDGRVLAGYVVVGADTLDAAVALAQGCPGLRHGASVEVGATVEMS
jgi:hypothetical protein